jgi:hypothetical protein
VTLRQAVEWIGMASLAALILGTFGFYFWFVYRSEQFHHVGLRPATVLSIADTSTKGRFSSQVFVALVDGRKGILNTGPVVAFAHGDMICVDVWESSDRSRIRLGPSREPTC